MSILLHIDSSPMGEASISSHLTREFVQRWRGVNPQGEVISRDLTTFDIPVIDEAWISADLTASGSRTQEQNDGLALSTEFTSELLYADEYVIGLPMHNWGPSSSFKLWADQIVRFGETIAITPAGPKGTLDKNRATFFIAAGRRYGPPFRGCSEELSGAVAPNLLWPTRRQRYAILPCRWRCRQIWKDRPGSVPCTSC